MGNDTRLGDPGAAGSWLTDPRHRAFLLEDARRQIKFFEASLSENGGFRVLDLQGQPLPSSVQELHTTTRLVHSFALAKHIGTQGADAIIDQGMDYLWQNHRDQEHGGYLWALDGDQVQDDRKLAYGHVFVLLAGASAKMAGHPDADRLIEDIWAILDSKFWENDHGLFTDEYNRDWTPFSKYRGMNANMHAVEALLTAYEATGEGVFIERAGRILEFFIGKIAPDYGWRIPEHFHSDWTVDAEYAGNPMFRPKGTTPGHSFELSRLQIQYWDLKGQPDGDALSTSRLLLETALKDAWHEELGGFVYTTTPEGEWDNRSRYWWPVTEAIGALATFLKLEKNSDYEMWYRRLWAFADDHLIDHKNGGWFPEINELGDPSATQFQGKPDIYHSVQATLFPLANGVSRHAELLRAIERD